MKEKRKNKIKQLRRYCSRKVKKNTNRHILYKYITLTEKRFEY